MKRQTYVMQELRRLSPNRPVSLAGGRATAERQAALLLALAEQAEERTDLRTLARLLGIEITITADLAVSVMSAFTRNRWHIVLRGTDDITQRRLSLARELWMVVMDGRDDVFSAVDIVQARQWTQECAAHFAMTLLMPKSRIYAAWAQGVREVHYLAAHFVVSQAVMRDRLGEIGLLSLRGGRIIDTSTELLMEGVGL